MILTPSGGRCVPVSTRRCGRSRSPVVDGLDQVEILLDSGCLLIHTRCKHLIAAFQNYRRARRGGEILDYPEDPQNPHEDLMDALRGGIRDVFPDGRRALPALTTVPAARLL
jgi:hypothetical protein